MGAPYATAGVYRQDVSPEQPAVLHTGVPAFLGYAVSGDVGLPVRLSLPAHFGASFGGALPGGYLGTAVAAFFANGGPFCYVVRLDPVLDPENALEGGLRALESSGEVDLVCAPDVVCPSLPNAPPGDPDPLRIRLQAAVLKHCEASGQRFAILDSLAGRTPAAVLQQREALAGSNSGALYYPWVLTAGGVVPPCGHVAGVYAASDLRTGVHKAPANELLEGVLDLETGISAAIQQQLNTAGVNCLRAFPGRGIRVWGARTLSRDEAWTYVNVRRVFLTAARWMEANLASAVYEPNDARLWLRITRELTAYFEELYRRGALGGASLREAFYVKCDSETNPPERRDLGMVVAEIGLAPAAPGEFVVVRIIRRATGATVSGP